MLAPSTLSHPLSDMFSCRLRTGKPRTALPSSLTDPFHMSPASANQKQRLKDLECGCKSLRYRPPMTAVILYADKLSCGSGACVEPCFLGAMLTWILAEAVQT